MNTKRMLFWVGFIVILGLIIWGLIVAMNREGDPLSVGSPRPVDSSDHVKGSESAEVTIIEYSDFQCPACRTYYYMVKRVVASSTVPVRLVYRHFPLAQHQNGALAAVASEAASLQGKFWEMHDILFENQREWEFASDPTELFVGYAEKIGLDMVKFKSDLSNPSLLARVESDEKEGQKIGVSYTPSFFVNGKLIDNPTSDDGFKSIIEAASKSSE